MQSTDNYGNTLMITKFVSNIKNACVSNLLIASPALYLSAIADNAVGTNTTIKIIGFLSGLTICSHIAGFAVCKIANFCLSQLEETEAQERIRLERFG